MFYLFCTALIGILALSLKLAEQGLAPDASLYAGLAWKINVSGEYWRLSASENMFPRFFEHPPYFFQWGSWIMSFLGGASDLPAKLMGLIPSLLGLGLLLLYFEFKGLRKLGIGAVLLLLVSNHFTKYAASSWIEAPLFLGVVLVYLACLEILEKSQTALVWILLGVGGFLCTSSKGVAGLGAALSLTVVVFSQLKKSNLAKSAALLIVGALAFCLPFILWAYKTYSPQYEDFYFLRYLKEQVLRSAATNRSSPVHDLSGSRFYYLIVLFKNLPHLMLLNVGLLFLFFTRSFSRTLVTPTEKRIFLLNALFFMAYFLPFSLVRFQLPHYLHPIYFCLALNASLCLAKIPWLASFFAGEILSEKYLKTLLVLPVLLLGAYLGFHFKPSLSKTSNRGQEFISVKQEVEQSEPGSRIWLSLKDVDTYRMESFALWYFKGHPWTYLEKQNEVLRPRAGDLLWDYKNSKMIKFGNGKF